MGRAPRKPKAPQPGDIGAPDVVNAKPKPRGAQAQAKPKGQNGLDAVAEALGIDRKDITQELIVDIAGKAPPDVQGQIGNTEQLVAFIRNYGDAAKWQKELGLKPRQAEAGAQQTLNLTGENEPPPAPSGQGAAPSPGSEKGELKARGDRLRELGMRTDDIDKMGMNTRDENIRDLEAAEAKEAAKKNKGVSGKPQKSSVVESNDTPMSVPDNDPSDALPDIPDPSSEPAKPSKKSKAKPKQSTSESESETTDPLMKSGTPTDHRRLREAINGSGPSGSGPSSSDSTTSDPSTSDSSTSDSGTSSTDSTEPDVVKGYKNPAVYNPFGFHAAGKEAIKTPNIGRRIAGGAMYYGPAALMTLGGGAGLTAAYNYFSGERQPGGDQLNALLERAAREREEMQKRFGSREMAPPMPSQADTQGSPDNIIRNLRQP